MPSASFNLSDINGTNGFVIDHPNGDDFDSTIVEVSRIGDLNGDGFADLLVNTTGINYHYGRYGYIYDDQVSRRYVVFGGTNAGVGGSIDLSNLNGSNGFVIDGINQYDYLGSSIISDRDINADGINDLIIGVPRADPNGVQDAGSVYVVYGGTNLGADGSVDLSSLDGSNGFVINGIHQFDYLGRSNISNRDINADGINDLIIGVPGADSNGVKDTGSVYVVYGGTNLSADGSVDLSSLNGSNGFVINGIHPYDQLDSSIINARDINADGINDFIISAPNADLNGVIDAGSVYVVYGGTNLGAGGSVDLSSLDGSNGFAINRINSSERLGWSISSDHDINADGITDIIIGVSGANPNRVRDAGTVYVLFGSTNLGAGGSIDRASIKSSNGFVINGINPSDYLGSSISSDHDINADGINDFIISAPGADPNGVINAGSIYVVYGGTTVGAGGSINLSSLDGSNGFAINGIHPSARLSYWSIRSDSDINADGITDIIIRAPDADPNGIRDAGSTYVVYGGTNLGANGSIDLSNLDGSNGFVINGINPYDYLGSSISSDRDINADGINDLIIGVPRADPNGVQDAGSVYVVYGGTNLGAGGSIDLSNLDGSNGFVINGINQLDYLGSSIVSAGDINGDGIDDVIIKSGIDSSSYVLFGSTNFQLNSSAVNDRGVTILNTLLTLNVLANDSNFAQITSFNATSTQGGTVTLDENGTPTDLTDDRLLYAPPTDFIGFDSFSYTIDNGQGGTSTATVNVGIFSQAGTPKADTLIAGNTGGEMIRGAAGNDLITGGDGNDKLLGNAGNDTLIGGLGNDILCGGSGNDVLTGGEGSDRFWLAPNRGTDTITDFQDGVDRLGLFNNLTFGQLSIYRSNNNALISVTNTGEVLATLTGVQANLLTAADFISSNITIG